MYIYLLLHRVTATAVQMAVPDPDIIDTTCIGIFSLYILCVYVFISNVYGGGKYTKGKVVSFLVSYAL